MACDIYRPWQAIASAEPGGGRVGRWADPYTAEGKDKDACGTVSPISIRFGVRKGSIYKIRPGDVQTMKQQIHAGGMIACGIDIYHDFSDYKGGIYIVRAPTLFRHYIALPLTCALVQRKSRNYAGAHAIAGTTHAPSPMI